MRKHISATALPRLATIAAIGFLVAGCGGGADEGAPPEDDAPATESPEGQDRDETPGGEGDSDGAAPETELTIELSLDEEAGAGETPEGFEEGTWTLTCSPAGGDHPDPEAACADLEEAGEEAFEEIPDDQVCTEIYGGPETARVSGHVGGTEVDTEFNKSGGCEIDRYKEMGAVLEP
ncbi:SSI family serine proteinase inhibitor [Allosalinactinospora lopnorensis]|uniref:SSI family serine proteinase inhibitor n=1 Tax=Allosalinactinospora lopnorensis TaxID=1352348 RepID=UPI000623C9B0|nr:SSI family serine proteinase inhibitor [Allosalinactinospora lopnorensis]